MGSKPRHHFTEGPLSPHGWAVNFREGAFSLFFAFVAIVAFGNYAPGVGFFFTNSSNPILGVINRGR